MAYVNSYNQLPTSPPPEIWLSSYQVTDNLKRTPAEPEFRTLDKFDNQFFRRFYFLFREVVVPRPIETEGEFIEWGKYAGWDFAYYQGFWVKRLFR